MSSTNRCLAIAIATVVGWGAFRANLAAAEQPEWDDLRARLRANADALSPISIEWERKSASPLDEVKWDAKVKSWCPQRQLLAPEQAALSFDGTRFYFRRYYHQARIEDIPGKVVFSAEKQLIDITDENAFDGESVYTGTGQKTKHHDSILMIDSPETMKMQQPDFPYMRPVYFYYAGFKLPGEAADVGDRPQSLAVHLLEHGGSLVGVSAERSEGVDCVKVSLGHKDRGYQLLFDPTLNYALRRLVETRQDGRAMRTATAADFEQLRPGLWFPRRLNVVFLSGIEFGKADVVFAQPIYSSVYMARGLSESPIPKERFTLKYTAPGTVIGDGRLPGAWTDGRKRIGYVIPADERMLDEAIQNAIEGSSFNPARRNAWYAIIAAQIAVVAMIVGWVLVWRRRKAKGTA